MQNINNHIETVRKETIQNMDKPYKKHDIKKKKRKRKNKASNTKNSCTGLCKRSF